MYKIRKEKLKNRKYISNKLTYNQLNEKDKCKNINIL